MMNTYWVLHQPYEPYAYALTPHLARLVLLVERGRAKTVDVAYGDRYEQSLTDETDVKLAGSSGPWDYYVVDVKVPTRRLKYSFRIETGEGTYWCGEGGLAQDAGRAGVFQLAYLSPRDVHEIPEWAEQAVCYQIFPERFANGNPSLSPDGAVPWDSEPTAFNHFGGDLPGITEHLDDLAEQGINLIYLTPIFKAGSNHKYDTEDYMEIDPQFGTKEDFRQMVAEAHKRKIRVVLDAVFNHSGFQFGPFQNAVKNGVESPYWDWFFIEGDRVDTEHVNYETFATRLRYMPKLNVANPVVTTYLLQVAKYWIREFDIDGWRLDVANEIDHVFWRDFRQAVKQEKPDALIIGEVWHNSLPWLRGDQFDSVMNYVFREFTHAYFIRREITGSQFADRIVELLYMYPEQATKSMFNLLGSHDTARVMTLADGNVNSVLLAFTFQFLYPGIPMMYYGDEVGMAGGNDPGCRGGMVWDEDRQNQVLKQAVRALAKLKQTEQALRSAHLRVVKADESGLEFVRYDDAGHAVYAAFNTSDTTRPVEVTGPVLFSTKENAWSDGQLSGRSAVVWKGTV